jgi:hypothetical protein
VWFCWTCTRKGENSTHREGDAYFLSLRDEERKNYEQWAWNFWQTFGRKMKVPPRLYNDLRRGGVSLKYIEADPSLEERGGEWDK